jgi:zinc protease
MSIAKVSRILITVLIVIILLPDKSFSNEKIPLDPKVRIGKLSNGVTYYIKENKKPENRMELRLAVNTGSICEDDDQKGLAHFVEHMCFNGTKHFPKQELISFLESIGVQFGPDLNAYTSFDETVYMLQMATDKKDIIEKGIQVLEDWAHNLSFEDAEIDKERGVILEEWRLGKGAEDRIYQKQLPIIFFGSKYAQRDVIGDTAVFLNVPHDNFRRYYRDWYRPDLMAVVAVGDFNVDEMEALIKKFFNNLKPVENARKREKHPLPFHKEVLVTVDKDKELANPDVTVMYKYNDFDESYTDGFRQMLVEDLMSSMLSSRMMEKTREANPPYQYAYSNAGKFLGERRAFNITCAPKGDNIKFGFETLLRETFRAKQNGFSASELERAKESFLRRVQKQFDERDKTESRSLVGEYIRNFLDNEPAPGIEWEKDFYNKIIPGIKIEEINALINKLVVDENAVITVSGPDREGAIVATKEEIMAQYNIIKNEKLTAYKDDVSEKPLFSEKLSPTKISDEKSDANLGIYEWKLANGAKVYAKATDFKNDEIMFDAYSPGGTSLLSDDDYFATGSISSIIASGGLGDYSQNQLNKYLQGKIVRVSPRVSNYSEAISGNSSKNDIETMFQMIYLYITKPRKDDNAFKAYQQKWISSIKDRQNMPEATFSDTVSVILDDYHKRSLPWSTDMVEKINYDKILETYKSKFSNAADFTFFFVGSFDIDKLKELTSIYLGNLPTTNSKETPKDIGQYFSRKNLKKIVKKGIEDKSTVSISYSGDFNYTPHERYLLTSLMDVLDIKLREAVREEKGGTYGIYAYGMPRKFPKSEYRIRLGFGCKPARVDELTTEVYKVIDSVKNSTVPDSYIEKVKETQKREREVRLKENRYWLQRMYSLYVDDEPFDLITDGDKFIENLNAADIQKTAQKYFNESSKIIFELFPEK